MASPLLFIDDKAGKPAAINLFIGKKPIFAFGNSDGDFEMLQWTTLDNNKSSLGLLLHHDDATREWAYDRKSHFGRLEKALDAAPQQGWHIVSMKSDWNKIFRHTTKK